VTWWVDRSTCWRAPTARPNQPSSAIRPQRLVPALTASLLAGGGGAGVWTFGRDVTIENGLSPQVTGLLWCLLGGAGLLGGLSGTLVRRAGLTAAWVISVGTTAASAALLAWRPGTVMVAAGALALFGCGFVALTGVLIAWGSQLAPEAAAQAAALLFIALTTGQAAGAVLLGVLTDAAGASATFVAAAGLVATAAVAAPRRRPSAASASASPVARHDPFVREATGRVTSSAPHSGPPRGTR